MTFSICDGVESRLLDLGKLPRYQLCIAAFFFCICQGLLCYLDFLSEMAKSSVGNFWKLPTGLWVEKSRHTHIEVNWWSCSKGIQLHCH